MLPPDLRTAEAEALEGLLSALPSAERGRWTVELRFEGLRLLPVVLRLATALQGAGVTLELLFSDAGATALARRDGPDLAPHIASFSDLRRRRAAAAADGNAAEPEAPAPAATTPGAVLLLVGATQADYEEVEAVCAAHAGPVVLINASLEDAAVGIGRVARDRRRGFLSGWQSAYALLPQPLSALRRLHPGPWELYRLDPDGYRFVAGFEQRPDPEQQEEALAGGAPEGLASTLRSVDRLLDGLQR